MRAWFWAKIYLENLKLENISPRVSYSFVFAFVWLWNSTGQRRCPYFLNLLVDMAPFPQTQLRRPGRDRAWPLQGTKRRSVCQSVGYRDQPEHRSETEQQTKSDPGKLCKMWCRIEALSWCHGEATGKSDWFAQLLKKQKITLGGEMETIDAAKK